MKKLLNLLKSCLLLYVLDQPFKYLMLNFLDGVKLQLFQVFQKDKQMHLVADIIISEDILPHFLGYLAHCFLPFTLSINW